MMLERPAQVGTKGAKCTDVSGGLRTHSSLKDNLGCMGENDPGQPVPLPARHTVNDVITLPHLFEQTGDLLRRMLQIIIHRDDRPEPRGTHPAEDGVVLAVVLHEAESADELMFASQTTDLGPAAIPAGIIDEDDLEGLVERLQHRFQFGNQVRKNGLAVEHGDDNRNAFG